MFRIDMKMMPSAHAVSSNGLMVFVHMHVPDVVFPAMLPLQIISGLMFLRRPCHGIVLHSAALIPVVYDITSTSLQADGGPWGGQPAS